MEEKKSIKEILKYLEVRQQIVRFVLMRCQQFINNYDDTRDWKKLGQDIWDDVDNYEEWIKSVFLELQRVLKDNGSFYWFHSEMEVIANLMVWMRTQTNFCTTDISLRKTNFKVYYYFPLTSLCTSLAYFLAKCNGSGLL